MSTLTTDNVNSFTAAILHEVFEIPAKGLRELITVVGNDDDAGEVTLVSLNSNE